MRSARSRAAARPAAAITRAALHLDWRRLRAGRVLVADLSIRDILDETPNTCQMTVMGPTAPPPGAELVITLGSVNSGTRLFAGKILSEEQGYLAQKPAQRLPRLNGIDYTWLLGQHLVIRQYTNQTVAFIATDLITSFAESITAQHIAADAGAIVIDAISFTNVALADALTQLCSRAGATGTSTTSAICTCSRPSQPRCTRTRHR